MKRKIILIIIAVIVVLSIPFWDQLFFLSLMIFDYLRTSETCPPPAISGEVIRSYSVTTDQGEMHPGDEYIEMVGDTTWGRTAGLLFAGKDGATFVVKYATNDPVQGRSYSTCRVFSPIESP